MKFAGGVRRIASTSHRDSDFRLNKAIGSASISNHFEQCYNVFTPYISTHAHLFHGIVTERNGTEYSVAFCSVPCFSNARLKVGVMMTFLN